MDTNALRQKILDLAIRGKLVPQDPNDEPASVLLERIRQEKQQMVKEGKLKPKDIKNDTVIFKGEDSLHYEKFQDGTVKCIEDEIPFEVPEGWGWTRLISISEMITKGASPKWQGVDYTTTGTLFVTSENVGIETLLLESPKYLSNRINEIQPRSVLKKHDVLTNIVGASIGRTCEYYLDDLANTNQAVSIIRLVNLILVDFIVKCLNSTYCIDLMFKNQVNVARANLSLSSLANFLIPIPPINEKHRIIKKITSLFIQVTVISEDKSALETIISKTKSKLLDLAIRGQLVTQSPEDEPAPVLLERIRTEKEELIKQEKIKRDKKGSVIFKGEDNSYYEKVGKEIHCINTEIPFDIPESWEFVRLKNIGEIVGGGTPKTNIAEYWDGNIPWLTPADFSNYEGMYISKGARSITEKGLKSSSARMLPTNSVLYSSRAPIGYIAIASNPVSTNQGFKSIIPYDFVMSPYLYYCLKARTDDIIQRATGTTFKEISGSQMAETIIPLPPINEQKQIFDKVTKLFDILISIEKSLS